jgi:hypothetical protein
MEIFERRRARLAEILQTMSMTELSRSSGVAKSSISSCLKRLPGGNYQRNIGEKTARLIEVGARKPEGWLDIQPDIQSSAGSVGEPVSQYVVAKPIDIPTAFETLRVSLACSDKLTRAQAKPILEQLFDDPEGSAGLGDRLSVTLGFGFGSNKSNGEKAA